MFFSSFAPVQLLSVMFFGQFAAVPLLLLMFERFIPSFSGFRKGQNTELSINKSFVLHYVIAYTREGGRVPRPKTLE
jgi:hypothetical protein